MLDNSTIGSLISSSKEGSYESKEFMMKYNNNKNPQLYKLFCECVSFHLDAKSDAVFYKILLKSQITNNEWELNRRYSDFSDFRLVLEYNFSCLPSLPSKTLTKVTNLPELESRKGNLNKFLKAVVSRGDLMSSMATFFFLELKNHYPDFKLFQPMLNYEVNDMIMEATGLDFTEEGNLLFVGMSDRKESKSLLNKFSNFIGTVNNTSKQKECGALVIHNLISSKSGEVILQAVYEKQYSSGISYLKYNKINTILSLGYDNGDVKLLKIYIRETSNVSKNLVDEVSLIKAHKKPIICIELDYKLGYVFSISTEGQLVISESNYQTNIKTVIISKQHLTSLIYEESYNLLILGDSAGSIYFYNVSNAINPVKLQALHSQFKPLSLIRLSIGEKCLDTTVDRLFIGTKTGELHIFDVDISKEGLHLKQVRCLDFFAERRVSVVNAFTSNDYVIVGYANGSVCVYSETNECPEYCVPFHKSSLGNIYYIQSKRMVISCSHDKSILTYQLPMYFPGEMMRGEDKRRESKFSEEEKEISNKNEFIDSMHIIDRVEECLISQTAVLKSKKRVDTDYGEWEQYCEDLDGWDS